MDGWFAGGSVIGGWLDEMKIRLLSALIEAELAD